MTELEINKVFEKEGPEIIRKSKHNAFQLVEQYANVYRDPNSTKEDLKNSANEAIRAMAQVMDQYADLQNRLLDMNKLLFNPFMLKNNKRSIN